jgi:hypothetical protein
LARPVRPLRRAHPGPDATLDDRETLKNQLDQVLDQYKQVKNLEERVASQSILEGYGRLDALNRIGNQVFSIDLKKPENYAGSSAPVHYPRIWNTPWFDWVQYNGSIMQPMVRNAGESLGVSAELNLTDPSKGLYKSSVDVKSLDEMEQMIKGDKPPNAKDKFSGLKSPKWPSDILPPIDQKLADKGADFTRRIARAVTGRRSRARRSTISTTRTGGPRTRPARRSSRSKTSRSRISEPTPRRRRTWGPRNGRGPRKSRDQEQQFRIRTGRTGREDRQLRLRPEETTHEPGGAEADRRIYAERTPGRACLQGASAQRRLGDAALPAQRFGADIEDLLGDPEKRPPTFYLGSREYDPVKLGYNTDPITNGFKFDTSDSRKLEQRSRIQERTTTRTRKSKA